MLSLVCALLAALPPPMVQGTVGESGAPVAGAQVTLVQGERRQVLRTRVDGTYRFRPFAGPGLVSVDLPSGWTPVGPGSKAFGPALPGDVVRLDFAARAQRSLRGRVLLGGAPLAEVEVVAGLAHARTDARGVFVLGEVSPGRLELRIDGLGLSGEAQIPASPGEVSLDFPLRIRSLTELGLVGVPQEPALRAVEDWVAARPMSQSEAARLEKLCALANLDAAFRLAILAHPADVGRAAPAAVVVRRFLTGPCLVAPQRVVFTVGEVASPGRLAVILARQEIR